MEYFLITFLGIMLSILLIGLIHSKIYLKTNAGVNEILGKYYPLIDNKRFYDFGGEYKIFQYKQQDKEIGDEIIVRLIMALPADVNDAKTFRKIEHRFVEHEASIKDNFKFKNRVVFCGRSLDEKWGNNQFYTYWFSKHFTYIEKEFSDKDFINAVKKAREYAENEFSKLEKVIKDRDDALLKAYDPNAILE